MRLATRLIIPHAVVASLLAIAILFVVVALVRITSLVSEIQRDYLTDLEDEERLYRAAWEVEVIIRRETFLCDDGDNAEDSARKAIAKVHTHLKEELQTYESGRLDHLGRAAQSYSERASYILEQDTCARLRSLAADPERLALDEKMTYAWIARVNAIREAFERKERETQRIAAQAITAGALLVILSWLAAAGIARSTARTISSTLASLAQHARRVGEGDFSPLPPVDSPNEIRALSLDLDRMRSRLAELEQLKQAFVASVSHDLRTPLARIREALALLADETAGPLTPRQRRVTELARAACEREIRLVTALLDLSRLRSARPIQRKTGSSIDDVLARAVDDVAEEAAEAGVEVTVDATGTTPRAALDAPLVERALVNLLSNAISFSKRGQTVRVVRLVTPAVDDEPPWVDILVEDEGPGVPADLRDRVFEPYATGGGPRNGIGLGLSIARDLIRAHGGELRLDPTERGATFRIRLSLGNDDGGTEPAALLPALRRAT